MTDKYCHFCGTHGHITVNCEFMAKLMTAMEHIKQVDNKTRKEIQDKFKQEQKKRRERKLARHANTIRKLLDTGTSQDEIEEVLTSIQDNAEDAPDTASRSSDSECDTDSE
jgi:chromatin segregation and condensation protein Rec8/ScpA/Scc1 (kleisin family)